MIVDLRNGQQQSLMLGHQLFGGKCINHQKCNEFFEQTNPYDKLPSFGIGFFSCKCRDGAQSTCVSLNSPFGFPVTQME